MRQLLHDHGLGHQFKLDEFSTAAQAIFVCACGQHWFPGFTWAGPTKRDIFVPFSLS